MLRKAFAILAAVFLLVLGLGLWLFGDEPASKAGLLWGLGGGLFTATSAVGGAYGAESRGLQVNQALAVVVVGMLFRLLFLGAFTLLAIRLGRIDGLIYVLAFGSVFLTGQVLEVWMLSRLARGRRGDTPRKVQSS